MQFGMPTLIENHTLEDNIRLCRRLGLQFLELNMNFPEYQIHELESIDRFYQSADEAGLYYTIHLDENCNIADFNMLVADAYLETIRRTIEAAKRLIPLRDKYGYPLRSEQRKPLQNEHGTPLRDEQGKPLQNEYGTPLQDERGKLSELGQGIESQPLVLNMHMHHGIYITLPDRKVQMYDRDFDTYMKSFIRFRSLCEEWIGDSDIIITIENTDGFRSYEKKAIEYLLGSDKFGLTWDIGHSKAAGENDVPFIMEHSGRLRHFHIHDGIAESIGQKGRNHLALGDGEINIQERLSIAEERNARCVLETKTITALEKSVEYLNELYSKEQYSKE